MFGTPVTARSNVNVALVKYWGKRDASLNLPATATGAARAVTRREADTLIRERRSQIAVGRLRDGMCGNSFQRA